MARVKAKATRVTAVLVVTVAAAAVVWWSAGTGGSPPADPRGVNAPLRPAAAVDPGKLPAMAFAVVPVVQDRFVPEPCNLVPGGGLWSLGAVHEMVQAVFPERALTLLMGDMTLVPDDMGRHVSAMHYGEILPATGETIVCAGEGELGLGAEFMRDVLTRVEKVTMLCANAQDPDGHPIARGWVLLDVAGRGVFVVGVVADSLQADIAARGSDILLASAQAEIAKARSAAADQASRIGHRIDTSVLLVHGTVDEAVALVRASPGFTFAAAAHGSVLPDIEPRDAGGTPVYYAGVGMRHVWRVMVAPGRAAPPAGLMRLGEVLLRQPPAYAPSIQFAHELLANEVFPTAAHEQMRGADPRGVYVGAEKCAPCHAAQAEAHAQSPHARRSELIRQPMHAGNSGCVRCHVTGPWHEGGWKWPPDASDLAAISCEACHGPGSAHLSAPAAGWGRVDFDRCRECHLPDRSPGLHFEAWWREHGHGK